LQTNMLRRRQISWIFEIVKLLLLAFSAYLTYGFLSRFLPNMWFRILALVLYEGGLIFWHFVHHYRSETPRQHMFSANMERLSLAAVASAAGYQLWSLVSAGFGDVLPSWTHFIIEIATSAIFLLNVWAFMAWSKRSRYYEAVERSYNKELASGQAGMVRAALAQTDTVVVEADENSAALPEASEADGAGDGEGDSAASTTLSKVIKMIPEKVQRARVEDRLLALESLVSVHPELSVKQLAQQTGLSERAIRNWRNK